MIGEIGKGRILLSDCRSVRNQANHGALVEYRIEMKSEGEDKINV